MQQQVRKGPCPTRACGQSGRPIDRQLKHDPCNGECEQGTEIIQKNLRLTRASDKSFREEVKAGGGGGLQTLKLGQKAEQEEKTYRPERAVCAKARRQEKQHGVSRQ